MSDASVTPPMRVHGWNIHFLAASSGFHFAGLFQPEGSDMITYRDVLGELRLCFDILGDEAQEDTQAGDWNPEPWSGLAFGFAGFVNLPPGAASPSPSPIVVTCRDLDQLVAAPPRGSSMEPGEYPIARFHLVRHRSCNLPATVPLASHLEAGCAQHIRRPIRRKNARYLPPKKPSPDPRFARLPLRKTMVARRGSQSPPKRSASGSVSPNKSSELSQQHPNEEEDIANMVVPPNMDILTDLARQTITGFRSSCLVAARQCAVTGKGRSWCISPAVGPALQACHIIPQQHYHLYPYPEDLDEDDDVEHSPRRLREAWQRTWSAENGILLLSHLHELFDARLFSIHPETLRIRAFVPYDVICDYHGFVARLPAIVDRNALRHHYNMCCIENMAAKMPLMEQVPGSDVDMTTSGTTSPFSSRANIPTISSPMMQEAPGQSHAGDDTQSAQRARGDPSKRTRPEQDDSRRLDKVHGEATPPSADDDLSPAGLHQCRSVLGLQRAQRKNKQDCAFIHEEQQDGLTLDEPGHEHKRKRRRTSFDLFEEPTCGDRSQSRRFGWPTSDSCITPSNCQLFLADVNWELRKSRSHIQLG
ncbi:hypothetical protein TOPH_02407 [Tolypocladium ophioglossoides CBS 100239]|uniref:HNH nuclease domain-containing protein n=1 Tax=Tolypocladium ophioglossoides (strain CBS 100239) TaxID=1163406 RepID=A0A0L0NFS6_TOLOC|nr:hypothetical protein TOPH_02407 [Tolypocladium ophioglossoides CBS 100239]